MKIGIITQARTSSTRLPRKILKTVKGKTLLEYHIERAQNASLPLVVATSTNKTDDVIEQMCKEKKWNCFRGDLNDVLSRYYHAAQKYNFEIIIRITSDCPLIDAELIKIGLAKFLNGKFDYLSNSVERTYPRGFDFEVFSFSALETAYLHAKKPEEREHVTPYIWRHSRKFRIGQLKQKQNKSHYRITVDEKDDFEVVKVLIQTYNADIKDYRQIIRTLDRNPEISALNRHVQHKKVGQ